MPSLLPQLAITTSLALACTTTSVAPAPCPNLPPTPCIPHVVLIAADDEYRSEESMPLLARMLKRDYGFNTTVCYAEADDGTLSPGRKDHISHLDAIAHADLLVVFARFRQLPEAERKWIVDYFKAGKPAVGFRTSTHMFRYTPGGPTECNDTLPDSVWGAHWITHHGHFGDNQQHNTAVSLRTDAKDNPILRGVTTFNAHSWLYHVENTPNQGADHIQGEEVHRLLDGHALHSDKKGDPRFPLDQPVAWTRLYGGQDEKKAASFSRHWAIPTTSRIHRCDAWPSKACSGPWAART